MRPEYWKLSQGPPIDEIMFTKYYLRKYSRNAKGQILLIALVIAVVGCIIIAPLLAFMGTGYKTTVTVYNEKAKELYAADAGFRDALWKIQNDSSWLPVDIGDTSPSQSGGLINGETVTYIVTRLPDSTYNATAYRIESHGSNVKLNKATTITSDVTVVNFSTYIQNAVTSPGKITTKKGDVISGNIQAPAVDSGTILATLTNGDINYNPVLGWPSYTSTNNAVARYYLNQVNNLTPFANSTIDISQASQQGPLYASGNYSYTSSSSGTLKGTVYINGDLTIESGTVNLNNQTLFVTGNLNVMPSATVNGPGAIIALGDIYYQPNQTNDGYIYIMSVNGTIEFLPNSNFTGSVAGKSTINLQPNNTFTWANPNSLNLNLPDSSSIGIGSIENWNIK